MKTYGMKQCILQRGNAHQISWLPEKFARAGLFVKLKDHGKWVDGWEIVYASGHVEPVEIISERARGYKNLDSIKNTTNLR